MSMHVLVLEVEGVDLFDEETLSCLYEGGVRDVTLLRVYNSQKIIMECKGDGDEAEVPETISRLLDGVSVRVVKS